MKRSINTLSIILALFFYSNASVAQSKPEASNMKISGQWFMSYKNGDISDSAYNKFDVTRGYLTFEPQLTSSLSGRITSDITIDDKGDVKVRLKYMYFKAKMKSFGFITSPFIEAGLAHRPFLDWQEHTNYYRVQGKMFVENADIVNSADFGVTFVSYLGGTLSDEYQKEVNPKYPGKYGSVSFGVYNGGGYHAVEMNKNKTIEGRLSIRPLPAIIPGLQFTYNGVFGKGNVAAEPDFKLNQGVISYENKYLTLMGDYITGVGNSKGTLVNAAKDAIDFEGYSAFCELKYKKFTAFGRYDNFNATDNGTKLKTIEKTIVGVGYKFAPKSKIILDFDQQTDINKNKNKYVEVALEIGF